MIHIKRMMLYASVYISSISYGYAQTNLTAEDWRSDLHYFQQLIHTKYTNLFYNVTEKQFDSAVAVIDKKIGSMNDVQMKVEFTKLVALFHVGHTAVRRQWGEGANFTSWIHPFPVRFYLFDDGLYIKAIHSNYKEAVGGKVIMIGNKKTDEVLQLIRPAIAFENEQGFKNMLQYYLNVAEILQVVDITDKPDKVMITYLKDGKENKITVAAENAIPTPRHGPISNQASWVDAYDNLNKPNSVLWLKEPDKLRYFEYMPQNKTVYVRHGAVQDEPNETIKEFFEKVFRFIDSNDVDRLVIDIRLNGGGNNYLNKSVITGVIALRKINRKGHFFVIIGKATFSAAQNLTNELEKFTEVTFVGEPTSENVNFYGDTRTEVLPKSKLNIALSWLWWQNLDPRDKRPWTAPHLAAGMTFTDYKNGNDLAMNVIMNYKNDVVINDRLRELVLKGQFEEAVTMAKKYIEDPLHRYYRNELETTINDYGYELLNANKAKEAKKILYMNVQLFPESANVYDSYAEACWKAGEKEEAIKYYQAAISKDPNGPTGENSKKMLEQIKSGN